MVRIINRGRSRLLLFTTDDQSRLETHIDRTIRLVSSAVKNALRSIWADAMMPRHSLPAAVSLDSCEEVSGWLNDLASPDVNLIV
jgi:hypothetical protein